ncbi:MAG: hypothetical protein RBU37_25450, partial [Myxococcota bacterium]|nr:hypothetical protein [Myxococcota bacterium]
GQDSHKYAESGEGAHAGAPLQVNITHSFQSLTCDAHHVGFGGVWGRAPQKESDALEEREQGT